jgi:hypothetical protein
VFMQAKWLKKQAGLRRRFQHFEFRLRFEDVICCTLAPSNGPRLNLSR